jgi:hypothetical protein
MAEPLAGGHDYVFIGSRTGPDDYLDTEDPRWAGSLVWVEQSDVLPGAQPRPGELGGDGTPWALYALGAVAAVATVAVVVSLSGDESPRRNPRRSSRWGAWRRAGTGAGQAFEFKSEAQEWARRIRDPYMRRTRVVPVGNGRWTVEISEPAG